MDTITITIPGKPEYLTMVRLATSSIAATAGFDVEAVDDLKNAVSEACKSVSCHGFDGFSDHCEVKFDVESDKMTITVMDACSEHSIKKLAHQCQQCPQEGDLAVFVIESLVDEMKYDRDEKGHKTITMIKRV